MNSQAKKRRDQLWGARPEEITDLPADHGDNPMTILDIADGECRWPVSGAGAAMLCCGGEAFQGLPYCARHCRMAYEQ